MDREPVEDIERDDHRHTQDGQQDAERGAGREPGQGELKAPADGCGALMAQGFAEQPVAARVLPDGVERDRGDAERDAVEPDGGSLAYR